MIEFSTVTREFRSLVARRGHMMTFLGSVFAATGIFLQNVLHGSLAPALRSIERHVFVFYALMVMVPTVILALRMARLHGGMVLNGVLYARLMQRQDFTRPGNPERAVRHNYLSVSFLQFLLVSLISGLSAAVVSLAQSRGVVLAAMAGAVVFIVLLTYYIRFHDKSADFALHKIATEECGPVRREEWEAHVSGSLEDANNGLLTDLAFVGLIVFSGFEKLSGLGEIKLQGRPDLAPEDVQRYGPLIYSSLMVVTCFFGLLWYLRVRVAIGDFSIQLDPTDRPFRPLRLTDSLLGYMLVAFLFAVSLHVLLIEVSPALEARTSLVLAIDAGAFVAAVLVEQLTLVVAGRKYHAKVSK